VEGTLAAFAGPGRPFELRQLEVPPPEPSGMVVRVLQANICGSDLHFWQGRIDLIGLGRPMPVVLGHEAVGVVEALGEGVETDADGAPLAVGDRVAWRYFLPCGHCRNCSTGRTRACQQNHLFLSQGRSADQAPFFVGPMATHHVLPPGQVVFRVPDGVANAVAAAANCAVAQAVQALHVADLRMGETVAVQGAGGLGLFACAVAKAMGAAKVVVLDAVPERLELAEAFGADVTLDLGGLPDARSRVRAVRKETDGGADVVCEFVGQPDAVAEGIGMVRPGGRYLECGCVHAGASFPFDPSQVALLSRTVIGLICYEPWALREALAFLGRTDGPWDRLTPTLYPLSDVDRAFYDAANRRIPRAAVVPGA
jgi:threonine dehydrogenase-like Zn-dependent dehydrogenase